MWDCSSEELIRRIEGLQDNQVIPMSQCGFIFFVSGMKIAIDVMVSDLLGSDGKSRRIVPPPFGCDELPSLDILLVTHDHADHLDRAVVESQMRRNPECRIIAPASILDSFCARFGSEKLFGMHLNDSMVALGSRKDRHAPLGEGYIGKEAFLEIVRHPATDGIPLVLETPDEAKWPEEVSYLLNAR